MKKISVAGVDLGQSCMHVHLADERGRGLGAKRLSRSRFVAFFAQLAPCLVGMEACRGAHHWARELEALGHTVRIMPAQFIKPYVKTNKNDWRDAEAIGEAVTRPTMRFVAVKTLEQQSVQMLHGARAAAVASRTATVNQLRGYLHEAGVVIPRGINRLRRELASVLEAGEQRWPALMVRVLRTLHEELRALDARIEAYERELESLARHDPLCQLLMTIPGIGPLSATGLVAKVGRGEDFTSARHFAAWLGLVPRHSGTGGRTQLYGISKRGDRYLRTNLIHGARSALRSVERRDDARGHWARDIAQRRGFNVATVALANKMARIAWAMLQSGQSYRPLVCAK